TFTSKLVVLTLLILVFCGFGKAFAQQQPGKSDSLVIKAPINTTDSRNSQLRQGILLPDPPNLVRTIEYDPATNQYILYEKVGDYLYRPPRYLTFAEYLELRQQQNVRVYFKQLADNFTYQSQQEGFIPPLEVRSHTFEQMFGSPDITIRP